MSWPASWRRPTDITKPPFARYQKLMMPFLRGKQDAAKDLAASFAPRTTIGILIRDLATWLMAVPFFADRFIGRGLRDDIRLPEYRGSGGTFG